MPGRPMATGRPLLRNSPADGRRATESNNLLGLTKTRMFYGPEILNPLKMGLGLQCPFLSSLCVPDTWNRVLTIYLSVPIKKLYQLFQIFASLGFSCPFRAAERLHLFPLISSVDYLRYFMLSVDYSLPIASDDGSLLVILKVILSLKQI